MVSFPAIPVEDDDINQRLSHVDYLNSCFSMISSFIAPNNFFHVYFSMTIFLEFSSILFHKATSFISNDPIEIAFNCISNDHVTMFFTAMPSAPTDVVTMGSPGTLNSEP